MPSPSDALWNEFAAETEEHLDALERLLSDRRGADWTRDEIGALFRYFHSLKGTFLAMGFSNVEALAHRCEDILSIVREGRAPLDRELAKILLRAIDRLKDMREEVIGKQADAKPARDILRELERHYAPAETAEIEAPPAPSQAPLSDDPEMLAIYTGGLAWLNDAMMRESSADFLSAKKAERIAMLDRIAYKKNETPDLAAGIRFFAWTRRMTVDAYYTSAVGIKEVGYMGNRAVAKFEVPQEAIDYAVGRSGL